MPSELYKRILAAREDYNPDPPAVAIQGDFRPRVMLPGQSGRIIDDFALELAKHLRERSIFNHGGIVSIMDDRTFTLRRISPTKFRSWIESPEDGSVVCQGFRGRGNDARLEDMSMSEECAKAVLESRRFINGLREVVRVNPVRLPVRRQAGGIELLPAGYDEESKILTIETVDYDKDMSAARATEVFEDLLKDTAFDPKDKIRSVSVATAMILAPYCDCMLSRFDERPAFIVTANSDGAGKTMLIRMAICPVFGPAKLTPPPHVDSDKLTELLNSIAQSGAPYVVLITGAARSKTPPSRHSLPRIKWAAGSWARATRSTLKNNAWSLSPATRRLSGAICAGGPYSSNFLSRKLDPRIGR
jgi:hypothetical protein